MVSLTKTGLPKRSPTCRKCGNPHLNFDPCPPKQVSAGTIWYRPRDGDLKDFGDRLNGSVVIAPGVYGRPRKPLHSETA